MKKHFLILILLLAATYSCTVTKRHYTGGWHVEWNKRIHNHHSVKVSDNRLKAEMTPNQSLIQESIQNQVTETAQVIQDTVQVVKKAAPISTQENESVKTTFVSMNELKNPADTVKKRQKWVPYKYRREQEEAEDQQRIRLHQQTNSNEEPQPRSGVNIATSILATAVLVYFGYGGTILLTAFCLLIFDFTITVTLEAYFAAFLLAWIMFAGITSLLLRMWMQPRKDETYKAFKKRLWNYSMLIAVGLALITVIVLGVILFL